MRNRLSLISALALLTLHSMATEVRADPACGAVEIRMRPGAADMQMVVWIEDAKGGYVDTAYVTRLTGQFGLANRPGTPLLKTDFRWPYGRREMVAPIWAHHRNHHYPKVVMGGACGNDPTAMCPDNGGPCGGDCVDSTIAYHSRVSSYEPFYCSPSGASKIDAMSCASKGTFSKGAYRPFPAEFSLYPPRADLNAYSANVDSADINDFAKENDLVAISQATPPPNVDVSPVITWFPQMALPVGDYVAWVELSQESDFNGADSSTTQPNQPDTVQAWDFEGHPFLGQPSILYQVPFHYDGNGYSAIATSYIGYSTYDGSDGVLHPPDATITTDQPGSGAGRLLDVNDNIDVYRVKVVVGTCIAAPTDAGMPQQSADAGDAGDSADGGNTSDGGDIVPITHCSAPAAPTNIAFTTTSSSITVTFDTPSSGEIPNRFAVRYHESATPLDDSNFFDAIAAPSISAGAPGAPLSVTITGLIAKTSYAVGVRGISSCNQSSSTVSQVITTDDQKFVTLTGCFVATAAYGSAMEHQLETLRRFRDTRLLPNAAGRLFVAGYYAFGPAFATAIARNETLRSAARRTLDPLVTLAAFVTR